MSRSDLWWCETQFVICVASEVYPDVPDCEPSCVDFSAHVCTPKWHDKCGRFQRIGPVDMEPVRLTAHHQDGRLIGLLAWDRCEDCEGTGRRLCSHDHHIPGDTTNGCVMYRPCPSCRDGWVPRAFVRAIGRPVARRTPYAVIPLEDNDDLD